MRHDAVRERKKRVMRERGRDAEVAHHESIGIAFCGWNEYDGGELSTMIVLASFRPSTERSYEKCVGTATSGTLLEH